MTVRRTGEGPSTVVTSAARSSDGNSGSLAIFDRVGLSLHLLVDVTTIGGTPTMDLTVEWSSDGSTFAVPQPAEAFTQITTTAVAVKSFTVKAQYYRIVWTIAGGSPSLTFSIDEYTT